MKTGTVKWFNPQKGHGFIRPDDGSPNILVHLSAVYSAGMGCLEVGQRVIFEIEQNERTGSIFAAALTPLEFESFREDRLSPKIIKPRPRRPSMAVSRQQIRSIS
jgi:cold shock protein